MKALDQRWAIIATASHTRPAHCFFVWHAMKELGDAFTAASVAAMTALEARHVEAIAKALDEKGWSPRKPVKKTERVPTSRLPDSFTAPPEWLAYARDKRLWTDAEVAEELEAFYGWTRAKGAQYADWYAAWQGHVRRSNRPNGTYKGGTGPVDTVESLQRRIRVYEAQGRTEEAEETRRQLERMNANVVPFRLQA